MLVYSATGAGTCACENSWCTGSPETCCVAGAPDTFEGFHNVVSGNAFGLQGSVRGGTAHYPSTAEVDGRIGVPRASGNSAGDVRSLRDPGNFDFRPRPGSFLAETCIGPYGPVAHGGDSTP